MITKSIWVVLIHFILLFPLRMLQEDPLLFQLYKDLVVSQIISAEEFWANRLKLSSVDLSMSNNNKQEVGISAAFLVSSNTHPGVHCLLMSVV